MSKVLGSLYEHTYDGKPYNFVITRNARLAIEDMQYDIFDGMGDSSAFTVMMDMKRIETELKMLKQERIKAIDEEVNGIEVRMEELEDELKNIQMEMIPNIKDFSKMKDKAQDEYEIAKILLMNSKNANGEVTGELADSILESLEATIGDEAYIKKLLEIYDKVFTQIAMIRDCKKAIDERVNLQNDKPIPMS